jgi:hypothetical protein
MPLILPGNVASAIGGYEVANSCRFNDGDSADMNRTFGTPTLATKYTISLWVKRSTITARQQFFKTSGYMYFEFQADDKLHYIDQGTGGDLVTSRLFRDPSAWYHICLRVDTTLGTADDRHKIYVNGTQETSFDDRTNPTQNNSGYAFKASTASYIGSNESTNLYFDGYIAEFVGIDGLALAPTSFGEFDEDSPTIWKPIDVSGLTFGTNGFYLDFEDSANLGNDANGGTDWTENNLAATDQASDSPTNNFSTWNPLDNYHSSATFSEGNLKIVTNDGAYSASLNNFGVSTGKWYAEFKCVDADRGYPQVGIKGRSPTSNTDGIGAGTDGYCYSGENGNKMNNTGGAGSSYGDSYTDGDIIGIALDLDNNKLYFSKNGTWQDSGDPTSGSTGTGAAFSLGTPSSGFYFFGVDDEDNAGHNTWEANFGSPSFAISSGNADANGYGNFEYSVPSGFYALCTKNLAEYGG